MKEKMILMDLSQEEIDKAHSSGLDGPMPSRKEQGLKWADSDKGNNVIRLMKGKGAEADFDSQKEDYVKIVRGGQMLDQHGNVVSSGDDGFHNPSDNPRSHIKKSEWMKWKHPLHPTETNWKG